MQNVEKAAEPSMEDILASIRKIISEEPSTPARAPAPTAAPVAASRSAFPAASAPVAAPPVVPPAPPMPPRAVMPELPPAPAALPSAGATKDVKPPSAAILDDDLADLLEGPLLQPASAAKAAPMAAPSLGKATSIFDRPPPAAPAARAPLPSLDPILPPPDADVARPRSSEPAPAAYAAALRDLGQVVPGQAPAARVESGPPSGPALPAATEPPKAEANLSPVSSLFPVEAKRPAVPVFGLDPEKPAAQPVVGTAPPQAQQRPTPKAGETAAPPVATVAATKAAAMPPPVPTAAPAPMPREATPPAKPQARAAHPAAAAPIRSEAAAPAATPAARVAAQPSAAPKPPAAKADVAEVPVVAKAPEPPAGIAPEIPKSVAPEGPAPAASVATATDAPRTLEDQVAQMLRPMLREWLDKNMPAIVEKALKDDGKS